MQTPFIGNIILFGGTFAPVGWLTCDGSLLQISQYDVLYNLIGTTYGGDGQSTFALPDLRGRIPVNQGQGNGLSPYMLGQMAGSPSVSLLPAHLPQHTHSFTSNTNVADQTNPANNFLAKQDTLQEYAAGTSANSVMKSNAVTSSPGGAPHANIMPSLTLNYIIATDGVYPTQS
ncbi:phage tail protein [Ferruginibacter sp.]